LTIENIIDVQDKKVNSLSEYMVSFKNKYNLDKVALLPSELIKIGTFVVRKELKDGD